MIWFYRKMRTYHLQIRVSDKMRWSGCLFWGTGRADVKPGDFANHLRPWVKTQ
jgi:hypothetical protein